MSSSIQTSHRIEDGRQVTVKVIDQGAVSYEFVAHDAPGDPSAYEYQGEGEAPEGVRAQLEESLSGGEDGDE